MDQPWANGCAWYSVSYNDGQLWPIEGPSKKTTYILLQLVQT